MACLDLCIKGDRTTPICCGRGQNQKQLKLIHLRWIREKTNKMQEKQAVKFYLTAIRMKLEDVMLSETNKPATKLNLLYDTMSMMSHLPRQKSVVAGDGHSVSVWENEEGSRRQWWCWPHSNVNGLIMALNFRLNVFHHN